MKKTNFKKETKETYNRLAKWYYSLRTKKYPSGWFYNELLEMPTTLKMLGNIKGKKILDFGCGPGIYIKVLKKKGAKLKGVDISEKMIKIAKKENPEIEFRVGNAENLPYKNQEFDIVLAALVMEYLADWNRALKEIKRVLKPKGLFIFSISNPVTNTLKKIWYKGRKFKIIKNYFKEGLKEDMWEGRFRIRWHRKTYGTIIKFLVKNGFEIIDYKDAKPIPRSKKMFPKEYQKAIDYPYFCTWKVRKKSH